MHRCCAIMLIRHRCAVDGMISDAVRPIQICTVLHNARRSDAGMAPRRRSGRGARRRASCRCSRPSPPRRRSPRRSPHAAFRIAPRGDCCATTSGNSARRSCVSSAAAARASRRSGAQWLRGAGDRAASGSRGCCRASRSTSAPRTARASTAAGSRASPSPRATTSRSPRSPRRCPSRPGVALDLSVMGSLNALREFGEGRADIAGFHVPIDAHASCRPRAVPALAARAARQARPLRRSRAGPDPAARQSGARAQSARRRRAQPALRQSPARLGNAPPDRPDARRRAHRRRRRSKASAPRSSRIRRSRRRSPRAAPTRDSGCARPPPNTGSRSSRWCASATSSRVRAKDAGDAARSSV